MLFMLFGILDLARIYTAMASVESAAREGADFGTSLGAERWSDTNAGDTIAEMERRACVAASDLHDFDWSDTDADGVIDRGEPCSNPSFAYCLQKTSSGPCLVDPTHPDYDCDERDNNDPLADPPCRVTVTMSHDFHLFVPFQIDLFGVQLGLPVSLPFERTSTFAMTDIEVAP
jgi:TadE-like protein